MAVIPLKVKFIKENPDAQLPTKGSLGAAGLDLHAAEAALVRAGETTLISTGLRMKLDSGYEAQVRSRSGLALKHSITVLNSPGTIDSDYRGIIGVILHNHSKLDFMVYVGDRIAQLVITPCITPHVSVEAVRDFQDATARGDGGFGSTGR